jgi:hypothetical protein
LFTDDWQTVIAVVPVVGVMVVGAVIGGAGSSMADEALCAIDFLAERPYALGLRTVPGA